MHARIIFPLKRIQGYLLCDPCDRRDKWRGEGGLHNLAISAETRNILHLHSQPVAVEDPDIGAPDPRTVCGMDPDTHERAGKEQQEGRRVGIISP